MFSDAEWLQIVRKRLHALAHELAGQEEEIGLDQETLLRIFESKAEYLAAHGSFSFDQKDWDEISRLLGRKFEGQSYLNSIVGTSFKKPTALEYG